MVEASQVTIDTNRRLGLEKDYSVTWFQSPQLRHQQQMIDELKHHYIILQEDRRYYQNTSAGSSNQIVTSREVGGSLRG